MLIGEGFAGAAPNAAHINLLLGAKDGPMGAARGSRLAEPGSHAVPGRLEARRAGGIADPVHRQGDSPQPGSRDHDVGAGPDGRRGRRHARRRRRYPAAGGAAALGGDRLHWVHWDADDADAIFANNRDAALAAARMAMQPSRISLEELRQALESQGNSFYTPRR